MNKKKLYLIFHGRFPSEKAASLFAAKSAEAFVDKGIETILLVPRRLGRLNIDFATYYGIKSNFKVTYIPVIDLYSIGLFKKVTFFISFFSFSFFCFFYLLYKAKKEDIIFSNESLPLFFASLRFKNTFYEMHDFPESKFKLFKLFLFRVRWILSHNFWKKEKLVKLFHIEDKKIIVVPNAVEVDNFDIDITREDARGKLNLPLNKSIVVYTGHLYTWKGVDVLAEAAKQLTGTLIAFVGGTDEHVMNFRQKYGSIPSLLIVGHKKHDEIPLWQKAADVLVLPNTAKEDISKYYTSPMKLFEYMASKRPIVASNIPSITEIVNNESAILVEPDNVNEIIRGINIALTDSDLVKKITDNAFLKVKNNTWANRAQTIIDFMNK